MLGVCVRDVCEHCCAHISMASDRPWSGVGVIVCAWQRSHRPHTSLRDNVCAHTFRPSRVTLVTMS